VEDIADNQDPLALGFGKFFPEREGVQQRLGRVGVRAVAGKILRDEVRHLAFQREFLAARLARLTPAAQRLWSWQFAVVHALTAAAVAWDHRRCLRALGVEPVEFRRRAAAARAAFARRLERDLATAELQACVS
jgi:hypothetical protein